VHHVLPPYVRSAQPVDRVSGVKRPHVAGPGPPATTLKGHHLLDETWPGARRAAGQVPSSLCLTCSHTKKKAAHAGGPLTTPVLSPYILSIYVQGRHIEGRFPDAVRGLVSPRETRPGHHAHRALLSSCSVIIDRTPTAICTVPRMPSSSVGLAFLGLSALPWRRPGSSPRCREPRPPSPQSCSAVTTRECAAIRRRMTHPRPTGPVGDTVRCTASHPP
jgi:hypothetical protein